MTTASDAPPKFELSFVQLIAGCLAAVTAAALASFFGVAGSLIGTAIGSILSTAGTAIYSPFPCGGRRPASAISGAVERTVQGRRLPLATSISDKGTGR